MYGLERVSLHRGELRRVGEITTPWPCFLIATRKSVVDAKLAAIQRLIPDIQAACASFAEDGPAMQALIVSRFGLTPQDAASWYEQVRISGQHSVSEAALDRTISTLIDAKVLPDGVNRTDLELYLDTRVCSLRTDIQSMKLCVSSSRCWRGNGNPQSALGIFGC
jgi:hypothetical protein